MGKALAARLNAQCCDAMGARRRRECGGQARYVGRRCKSFVTALGEMELECAWYHCDACHRGLSPRDRALGFDGGSLSPAVRRMAGIAGAETSFERASTMLHELAGFKVGAKQVERYVETLGRDIARDEREVVEPEPSPARTLYVGLDGTGVPVRKCETVGRIDKQPDASAKTREVKLVTVWSAERRTGRACTVATAAPCRAMAPSRASPAATPTAPRPRSPARVPRELQRRGFAQAERRAVLGDGAGWNWKFADEHLPGAIQIVDLFHAKQHIFDVAKALYGPDSDLAEQWARPDATNSTDSAPPRHQRPAPARRRLRRGAQGARLFHRQWRTHGLSQVPRVGAVRHHRRRRGHLQVRHRNRLKRGGMGANAIIALRCAITSNRFDDYWERQAAAS